MFSIGLYFFLFLFWFLVFVFSPTNQTHQAQRIVTMSCNTSQVDHVLTWDDLAWHVIPTKKKKASPSTSVPLSTTHTKATTTATTTNNNNTNNHAIQFLPCKKCRPSDLPPHLHFPRIKEQFIFYLGLHAKDAGVVVVVVVGSRSFRMGSTEWNVGGW